MPPFHDTPKRRKRYRFKKRFFVLLGILIFLLVLAIVLLFHSCQKGRDDASGSGNESSQSASLDDAAKEEYLSETLFIGDSRTLGLATYGLVPDEQVIAKDGLNHQNARTDAFVEQDGQMLTIAEAVGERKPKRMIISFGINGMSYMSESQFMEEYKALIWEIHEESPNSIIILQAIYPISAELSLEEPGMSNDTIDSYNQKIQAYAKEQDFFYLSTDEVLKDSDGALNTEYSAGDGLHLNPDAYDVILDYILSHPFQ